MLNIETRLLFTMRMKVETQPLGATRGVERRVVIINECVIEGERLNGRALPGGSDWLTIEPDGALMLDCRMVIRTDDDALIGMQYRGVRHGSPEAVADKWARGERVDSSEYYHCVAIFFDTTDSRYKWLNRILAIGKGRRLPTGGVYEVFEVL